MDTSYIKEEIVEYDGTNFYVLLTKKEIEELDKFLNRYKQFFRVQQGALSSLIKRIIENTYLYINNNEIDIDDDINKILQKKYYKDLNPNFIDYIKNDTRARDFIVELVRVRTLKKYNSPEDDDEVLEKKQLRLAKDDVNTMSILMGSSVFTKPEYISSLIRYFLKSNKREIFFYKSYLTIEEAIKNKEYIIILGSKVKPIKIIKGSFSSKRLVAFDETRKRFVIAHLNPLLLRHDVCSTMQKYSINQLEENILNLYNQLTSITISYDKTDMDCSNIRILSYDPNLSLSLMYKKTVEGKHETITFPYDYDIIDDFRKFESDGYITNLVVPEKYELLESLIKEYKRS